MATWRSPSGAAGGLRRPGPPVFDPLTLGSPRFRHVVFADDPYVRRCEPQFAVAPAPSAARAHAHPDSEDGTFVGWLFGQAGLDVEAYGRATLHRRLPSCLRALRVGTSADARRLLERHPAMVGVALSAMMIGVTWFFRDPPVFDVLRDDVLPALAGGRGGVRIWSVGCSDGAELYSVAILLAERGLLADSYLLGTDCRGDAIARARAGTFPGDSLKLLGADLVERYFVRCEATWHVSAPLRAATRWRTADVLSQAEPGFWDLILCRNVAIYLRDDAAAAMWRRLVSALRRGGVLAVGKAERPSVAMSLVGPCLYRRDMA